MDVDGPELHLASDPQRVGQAVTHLLILNRSESVNVNRGDVLQPFNHLYGPPLDPLQQIQVFLMLGYTELDAILQMGSHQSGKEEENHLPQLVGHTVFDAAQDVAGFLGCKTHCRILQDPLLDEWLTA
ncbi:hypothetical protein WISP_27851 [Willisornis vidua]|uniref:Uncharacterized protein n=1 Tax=Willisornis vidua TaxID=1566151 RepID=A0ABQ9DL83_9PASS|nr:hypothetical protein WISP_27851 [Willisornis vidua]